MAGLLSGDSAHLGMFEGGSYKHSHDKPEEYGGGWYFSRKEIEENSPSRRDGIDLKKETYLRKSYCTFLQDLGMRLKVPQVTIATAIIFCHRFFLRQSHSKNDRRTVATVCMFLAGKVEETPRPLKDVILVSYEIIHKKDPEAIQRIKQKEVYEQQKELTLIGERVVLVTLGFDLNLNHPYKPLVDSIKKFKVAQNALAQVAWNFVNDGLRTSLCLQFMPHHIAAGAIFLAAKFLKVKLPSDGEKVWWQEFDVTPRQLEEVSNQMLELYEQNRVPPSQTSEVVEGSAGGGVTQRASSRPPAADEDHATNNSNSQGGVATSRPGTSNVASSRLAPDHIHTSYPDSLSGPPKASQSQSNEELNNNDRLGDGEINDNHQQYEPESLPQTGIKREAAYESRYGSVGHGEETQERELGEFKDKYHGRNLESKDVKMGQSPQDAMKKIDKDKVKAALEKRKKVRVDVARRTDVMDDDDLIERELEDGIELAAESDKTKQDKKHNWSTRPLNQPDHENEDGQLYSSKGQSSRSQDFDHVEEGEVGTFDDADRGGYKSPKSSSRKRKAGSPPEKPVEGKQRNDHNGPGSSYHHDYPEDRSRLGKNGYSERDHKRHIQKNHV